MQSRSQRDLMLAEKCVSELENGGDAAKIYGGLCHEFPILVQNAGLCQAMAFHAAKAAGEGARAQAHSKLLEHIARILEVDKAELLEKVRNAETREYFAFTRRVLSTFVFFKRFAVSILRVEAGERESQ